MSHMLLLCYFIYIYISPSICLHKMYLLYILILKYIVEHVPLLVFSLKQTNYMYMYSSTFRSTWPQFQFIKYLVAALWTLSISYKRSVFFKLRASHQFPYSRARNLQYPSIFIQYPFVMKKNPTCNKLESKTLQKERM